MRGYGGALKFGKQFAYNQAKSFVERKDREYQRKNPRYFAARTLQKGYYKYNKGYHVPGYKYLGPGTYDMSRKPRNRLDKYAREHDLAYGRMGSGSSWKPYYTYNKADRRFLRKIRNIRGPAAGSARFVFRVKKRYFPRSKNMPKRRRYRK